MLILPFVHLQIENFGVTKVMVLEAVTVISNVSDVDNLSFQ